MAALEAAEDRAAGAAEEDDVAMGVDHETQALVRLEAQEEGDGRVAEDMDVRQVEGEGAAGSVGGGDAEGEAAEGRGHVVAECVAGGGGLERGRCDLGLAA